MRGWQVPAYSMPANQEELVVQRILVRTGFSRDLAGLLLDDMKSAIGYLTRRPPTEPAEPRESTAFSH